MNRIVKTGLAEFLKGRRISRLFDLKNYPVEISDSGIDAANFRHDNPKIKSLDGVEYVVFEMAGDCQVFAEVIGFQLEGGKFGYYVPKAHNTINPKTGKVWTSDDCGNRDFFEFSEEKECQYTKGDPDVELRELFKSLETDGIYVSAPEEPVIPEKPIYAPQVSKTCVIVMGAGQNSEFTLTKTMNIPSKIVPKNMGAFLVAKANKSPSYLAKHPAPATVDDLFLTDLIHEFALGDFSKETPKLNDFEIEFTNISMPGKPLKFGLNNNHDDEFIAFRANGTNQCPATVIGVQLEDGTLGFYVPLEGNTICSRTMKAYGRCDCSECRSIDWTQQQIRIPDNSGDIVDEIHSLIYKGTTMVSIQEQEANHKKWEEEKRIKEEAQNSVKGLTSFKPLSGLKKFIESLKGSPDLEDDDDDLDEDYGIAKFLFYNYRKTVKLNDFDVDGENLEGEGFEELDGIEYFRINAGGDWEEPADIIAVLLDGEKIGLYCPKAGNIVCPRTMKAYGTCDCEKCEEDSEDGNYDHKANPGNQDDELRIVFGLTKTPVKTRSMPSVSGKITSDNCKDHITQWFIANSTNFPCGPENFDVNNWKRLNKKKNGKNYVREFQNKVNGLIVVEEDDGAQFVSMNIKVV